MGKTIRVSECRKADRRRGTVVVYKKLGGEERELLVCTAEYFTEKTSGGRGGRKRYEKVSDIEASVMRG